MLRDNKSSLENALLLINNYKAYNDISELNERVIKVYSDVERDKRIGIKKKEAKIFARNKKNKERNR